MRPSVDEKKLIANKLSVLECGIEGAGEWPKSAELICSPSQDTTEDHPGPARQGGWRRQINP